MKKSSKLLSFLFVLFFLSPAVYAQGNSSGNQKNFLWKVHSGEKAVYILGSIHYLKKDMYPLSKKIEDAFDKSGALAVEADVNKSGEKDLQEMLANALYQDTDTIEKHLTKETHELLKTKLAELGIPLELAGRQKPWFLSLTLSAMELMKMGFDPNLGIDKYFLSKAAGKKKIVELESLDYQINLFMGFSDSEQELLLLYTLKDLNVMEQEVNKLVRSWASGDAKGMESIIFKSLSEDKRLAPVYEKLIYERNIKMAYKIEGFLKAKETYFVVVGAGHLVGDKGIINILRGKGYRTEQI